MKYGLMFCCIKPPSASTTGYNVPITMYGNGSDGVTTYQNIIVSRKILDRPIQFYYLLARGSSTGQKLFVPCLLDLTAAHAPENVIIQAPTSSNISVTAIPNEHPNYFEIVRKVLKCKGSLVDLVSEGQIIYVANRLDPVVDYETRLWNLFSHDSVSVSIYLEGTTLVTL